MRRRFLLAAAAGGVAAGIVSTVVQVGLWLLFTDAFPAILRRDARLTAAHPAGWSWPSRRRSTSA